MLLARLGLRGAEAAGLQLAGIDWQAGEITVTGKGSQTETMPLPADVGQALADYLTKGRPRCSCAAVFVTARAPYHQITPSVVRALMPRACDHAGLPRAGAHRLRHSLATGCCGRARRSARSGSCCGTGASCPRASTRRSTTRGSRWSRGRGRCRPGRRPGVDRRQDLREHAEEYLAMRRALGSR